MRKSIFITLVALLAIPVMAMAQRTVTGKVVDADTESPLIGASLYWKNTTAGATSAANGAFSIKRVSGFDTLVVEYLGYEAVEQDMSDKSVNDITIALKPSAVGIDGVVIEGMQRGNFAKSDGITRQEQISFAGLCKMACCRCRVSDRLS
jgi:hypothetical protein